MKLKQLIKTAIKRVLPKSAIGAYHLVLTWAGAVWFWFPSRKIKVIGVTGTNGKSTTAMMIATILSRAGFKTAV
ncbi:MAG TPA: Mur ligase family protein, partial [Candidatus Pacearchaeota archaeon]|nr:Mur ligase family protein [Candidatus Pacearchaeota archaeon]